MGLIINEDYETFASFHPVEEMNEQGLCAHVDKYFRGGASLVFFNVSAQRAYFDSQVYEPIWQGIEKGSDGKYYHRGEEVRNKPLPTLVNALQAKILQEQTGNPYQIRIDQCRRNGGRGGLSIRMNDCHLGSHPNSPMHSDLWFDHPEWRLPENGLDFAVPEVRAKLCAFLEEIFTRFDMDGVELDWMRSPPFFHVGEEDKNSHYLDEIVRYASDLKLCAEKRLGHSVELAVRVPSRPEEALCLGLDVTKWARCGWIDMVIASAYICSTDSSMPLAIWQQLLPASVEIIPGIDILSASHSGVKDISMHEQSEIAWGYAAAFYHRGVKDIYLFNYFPGITTPDRFREKLFKMSSPELAECAARRHIATMRCNFIPGIAFYSDLPLKASERWQSVRIEIGRVPENRQITLMFSFEAAPDIKVEEFEFAVNEIPCPIAKESFPYEVPEPSWRKVVCAVPPNVLKGGSAVLSFRAKQICDAILHWCELDVASVKD